MDRDEWIRRFAEELGTDPPSDEAVEALLALAGTAAHATERTAAPIACYLAGRVHADLAGALATATAIDAGEP